MLLFLRGMGAGGLKRMAAMGALIGWSNWLLLFALSAVLGGLVAVFVMRERGHAPGVAVAAVFTASATRGR